MSGQGPEAGTVRVTAEWMKEYGELESRYGRIDEDRQIKTSDGGFVIPSKVSERYQFLKMRHLDREVHQ